MFTLLGLVVMYWGVNLMDTDYDIESPFAFFGGLVLIFVGFYIFGISLEMSRSGSAFG